MSKNIPYEVIELSEGLVSSNSKLTNIAVARYILRSLPNTCSEFYENPQELLLKVRECSRLVLRAVYDDPIFGLPLSQTQSVRRLLNDLENLWFFYVFYRDDVELLRHQNETITLFDSELFPTHLETKKSGDVFEVIGDESESFLSALRSELAGIFWLEWYQGFLDGKPIDWELQRRVALIPDPIWEAGPEAAGKEIERIRAAYEVEKRARELEESARKIFSTVRGIGHNNPPAPIDKLSDTSDGITIIWDAARELREQAQSPQPEKHRVHKAVDALVRVAKACGIWTAQKIDTGLNAAAAAIGATLGTTFVVWMTSNSARVMELIDAAKAWLGLL